MASLWSATPEAGLVGCGVAVQWLRVELCGVQESHLIYERVVIEDSLKVIKEILRSCRSLSLLHSLIWEEGREVARRGAPPPARTGVRSGLIDSIRQGWVKPDQAPRGSGVTVWHARVHHSTLQLRSPKFPKIRSCSWLAMGGSEEVAMSESRAGESLTVSADERARVDALCSAAPSAPAVGEASLSPSFFEGFALRGIRVRRIHPGSIACSFTVPNSLTDSKSGCLAAGAVVSLVDEIGSAAAVSGGGHLKVSVDMSVSFVDLSRARPGDELRITARLLGNKGAYAGTHVLFANAATGEVVAEGTHSLFGKITKVKLNTTTARSKM